MLTTSGMLAPALAGASLDVLTGLVGDIAGQLAVSGQLRYPRGDDLLVTGRHSDRVGVMPDLARRR